MVSATTSWNTEKARRTVIPREVFSPDSAGSQKRTSDMTTMNEQGVMMFRVKKAGFRCRKTRNDSLGKGAPGNDVW